VKRLREVSVTPPTRVISIVPLTASTAKPFWLSFAVGLLFAVGLPELPQPRAGSNPNATLRIDRFIGTSCEPLSSILSRGVAIL
jgi:hypothetical protein